MKLKTKITLFSSLLLFLVGISSCFKSEEFDLIPFISDAQVEIIGDSAVVTFSFQDGDADIGLAEDDTLDEFSFGSYYYNNIYLSYYEKDDNLGWVEGKNLDGDPLVFPYRIKPISVSENTEGIKGTMDITIENYPQSATDQWDTTKFKIILIDRAKNVSNEIETGEIIFP
jgi:hypothetical protein